MQYTPRSASELSASELLAVLWEHGSDGLILADAATGRIVDANPNAERILGRSRAELCTLNQRQLHPRDQQELAQKYFSEIKDGAWVSHNIDIEQPDGHRVPIEFCSSILSENSHNVFSIGIIRDMSERIQSERDVRRLNWVLRAIARANLGAASAETEADLMRIVCEGIIGGVFNLAWIGTAANDSAQTVHVSAASGPALGYLDGLSISWADVPHGQGPTGRAIRQGVTQVNNHAMTNPLFQPWAARASQFGIQASLATPLVRSGTPFGALTVYANQADVFGPEEISLFEELARGLVFAMEARRAQAAYLSELATNAEQSRRFERALEQMVATLAATIEKRDPYTAGHQRRVAEFAQKIALAMELGPHRSHVIFLAGLVHDVGKIQIPAEILNKPGVLTAIEYELVKSHVQASYDILIGVDFPWPLAEIALQHHERLDGSGYPRGLAGEAILLEARILAVADVFEAVSSHRPYRPALGEAAAVDVLIKQRDRGLDAAVVDIALCVLTSGLKTG